MDGIRLNDSESLEAFGVNKQKIVEEITRAYAHQIYIDGFFNGDPHPGNVLSVLFILTWLIFLSDRIKSLDLIHTLHLDFFKFLNRIKSLDLIHTLHIDYFKFLK